ncbi:MAG: hypothetical protein AAF408_15120 [Pseudomonadota bacterium]
MADTKKDELDLLFDAAKRESDLLPADLAARIVRDAQTEQAAWTAKVTRQAPSMTMWQQILSQLGGWPGLSGLATACAAGVWIGLAPPVALQAPMQLVWQSQVVDDLYIDDGFDAIQTEEG